MKYRLTLYEPVPVYDRFGAAAGTEFRQGDTVYAERVKFTGRQRIEHGESFADYSAQYNIRDRHRIDDHWRVKEAGGHLYTVTNIIPNHDRGMQTLVCERVNE